METMKESARNLGEAVLSSKTAQASLDLADNMIMYAHTAVDNVLPPSSPDSTDDKSKFL